MDKEEVIREIAHSDAKIVECIKSAPQTFNSILQFLKNDGTLQCVLRRRISRLLKNGELWKMKVPGTRYGLCIFCTPERDYKIMVMQHVVGVKVFYMYDYERHKKTIELKQYWELKGPNWSKWEYNDEPFTVPLYSVRDEGFRLWE